VDARDHVWLLQRPERVTPEDFVAARERRTPGCCANTAPPRIKVDPEGNIDFFVDPERNEIYIADGYENRWVIVYDPATGAYRRYWGAYGNERVDGVEVVRGSREPGSPPPAFFNLLHGIDVAFSNDPGARPPPHPCTGSGQGWEAAWMRRSSRRNGPSCPSAIMIPTCRMRERSRGGAPGTDRPRKEAAKAWNGRAIPTQAPEGGWNPHW